MKLINLIFAFVILLLVGSFISMALGLDKGQHSVFVFIFATAIMYVALSFKNKKKEIVWGTILSTLEFTSIFLIVSCVGMLFSLKPVASNIFSGILLITFLSYKNKIRQDIPKTDY